jgi:predicted PurR-regulated permease PerM
MTESTPSSSPRWGSITKLVLALTGISCVGLLLVRFHSILAPVVMAFMVAYLLQPFAAFIERKTPLSWRVTVSLIYLVFILLLAGLVAWGGVGLVQQVTSLIGTIQATITGLPTFIQGLSGKVYHFGPIVWDFSKLDWTALSQQVISYIQPALGRLASLVAALAGSAATTLGWAAFILLVSYFFLVESGGLRGRIIRVNIPGYAEDFRRLRRELTWIWDAFLRGQIIIFLCKTLAYMVLLSILGVHYALGLALLGGFASFLPYIGPAINYLVIGLVSYFQGGNMYGLLPLAYTLVALGCCVLIDQTFDNLVSPRIMAHTLKVHPAYVLIAAIIAANLFGLLGIIVAAPLLATFRLFGEYILNKMLDKNPWPEGEERLPPPPGEPTIKRVRHWFRSLRKKKA